MKKVLTYKHYPNAEYKENDVEKKMLMFSSNSNIAVTLTNNNAYHFITVSAEETKITIYLSYDCIFDAEKLYDIITDWVMNEGYKTLCVETEVVKKEFSCGHSWCVQLKSIDINGEEYLLNK